LKLRQRLQPANRQIRNVYFIETGIASVIAVSAGDHAEIGIVGRDGMTGPPVVHGADHSPYETVIQV
jgi:hypothetical protein